MTRSSLALLAAAAGCGAGMLAVFGATASPAAQVLTGAGALLVLASLTGPLARRPATGGLAAVAGVALAAAGTPGLVSLAAGGLLMLGYLLLLDAPRQASWPAARGWLRQQAAPAAWALAGAAAVVTGLTVPAPASAWLAVGGIAAAVAAAVTALPRARRRPGPRS
ncbi:MAG: hypothetical protein J2P33_24425 [Actinobacteria bacterium]|nr:hypothetical protein [Actinomycetota bacterium]